MCAPTNLAYCGPAQTVTISHVLDPASSTLVASPNQVLAAPSAQSNITLTTRAANGVQLFTSVAPVTMSTNFGTLSNVTNNNDGTYSATLTSDVAGTATVTATVDGVTIPATAKVDFLAGPPAVGSGLTGLVVTGGSKTADGVQSHTATVTLKDAQGNPLSGKDGLLSLAATPATGVTAGSFTQVSPGVYEAAVTSTVAGAKSVAATFDAAGANLAIGSGTATFVPGAPTGAGQSTVSATTTPKRANSLDAQTLTVRVKDSTGNPVPGIAAQLSVPVLPSGVSVGNFTETTAGVYTAQVTSSVAATSSLAVVFDATGSNVTLGSASVTFALTPVAPVVLPSNGTSLSGTATPGTTVTVFDSNGDPLGQATVQPDGTFNVAIAGPATEGATLTAVVSDAAGLQSPAIPFVVDTTAPSVPVVDSSNGVVVTG
ncbi:invasin domain 3-containing protein, partial [Klugiella xanthotipulae]